MLYHIFQQGEHGLSLGIPITANGRLSMVDLHAAKWFDMSVEWLYRNFGRPEVIDKPYEFDVEIFPKEERYRFLERQDN
jgi:hypothetical protein